jgi:hypothetical protein
MTWQEQWPSVALLSSQHDWKSSNHHPSCEGPWKVVARINYVVFKIQRHPRTRMKVVHHEHVLSCQGTALDKQPWGKEVRLDAFQTVTTVPFARTGVYTLENKKCQHTSGLRGARSFEEGTMWHDGWKPDGPLLGKAGKCVCASTNGHATIEKKWEIVFSVRSLPRLYSGDERGKQKSHSCSSRRVVRH